MRLINCSTKRLEEFFGDRIPPYTILSHTWGHDEVTFADLTHHPAAATGKDGHRKIDFTCAQTLLDGYGHAWVDTCCIDKSSSAELSEAINSMFDWYAASVVCYAYLSDVSEADGEASFEESRWFTRGWTLQELLAPTNVVFFDSKWTRLGMKLEISNFLSTVTGIDIDILLGPARLQACCVAKKMSWAAHRETTRLEDAAYSLLGIFSIAMPLLYGEGTLAFVRLQEEIIRRSSDDSIFAWGFHADMERDFEYNAENLALQVPNSRFSTTAIFARSPSDFQHCGGMEFTSRGSSGFNSTNLGLQINFPLVFASLKSQDYPYSQFVWVALLSSTVGSRRQPVGILLQSATNNEHASETVQSIELLSDGTHTIALDPRIAARATIHDVIVIWPRGNRPAVERKPDYIQVVVNESENLRKAGFRVMEAEASAIGRHQNEYATTWHRESKLLTIESSGTYHVLLSFTMEVWTGSPEIITIFARTDPWNYLTRRGAVFSANVKHYLYHHLGTTPNFAGQGPKEEARFADIKEYNGREAKIHANMTQSELYGRKIINIEIDTRFLATNIQGEDQVQIPPTDST
jgi:hypothetical protein